MAKKQDEIPVFPMAGWQLGPVPTMGVVMFQPFFVATAFDTPDQAQEGRRYVLTPEKARELGEKLISAARKAETSCAEVPPVMKN